jgi:ethanolamine transporter EutH
MNKPIIGLGVIILIVALPVSIYSATTYVPYANAPVNSALLQEKTSQPYLTEGLILALVAIIIIAVGLIFPSRGVKETSDAKGTSADQG